MFRPTAANEKCPRERPRTAPRKTFIPCPRDDRDEMRTKRPYVLRLREKRRVEKLEKERCVERRGEWTRFRSAACASVRPVGGFISQPEP